MFQTYISYSNPPQYIFHNKNDGENYFSAITYIKYDDIPWTDRYFIQTPPLKKDHFLTLLPNGAVMSNQHETFPPQPCEAAHLYPSLLKSMCNALTLSLLPILSILPYLFFSLYAPLLSLWPSNIPSLSTLSTPTQRLSLSAWCYVEII